VNGSNLPPILMTVDLRLIGMGKTPKGNSYLQFATPGTGEGKVEVIIYVSTETPGGFLFGYSLWDIEAHAIVSYHGPHGDPDKDHLGQIDGV